MRRAAGRLVDARAEVLRVAAPIASRFYGPLRPVAQVAGEVAWRVSRQRRRRVMRNLVPVCGGERERVRAASRQVFRNNALYWLEMAATPHRRWRQVSDHVEVEGQEWLRCLEEPGPLIIAGAHTGNSELAIHLLSELTERPFVALVEPMASRRLARQLLERRNTGRLEFVEANLRGLRRAFETLERGGIVGVLADRDLAGTGVCVRLCGRKVRLPRGPWELARRSGARILPAFASRVERDRFTVALAAPICIGGPDSAGMVRAAQQWAELFEEHLRRDPGQWIVTEDYWRVHGCGQG